MNNLKEQARAFVKKRMVPMIVDEDTQFHAADLVADFTEQQLAEKEKEVVRLRTALGEISNRDCRNKFSVACPSASVTRDSWCERCIAVIALKEQT